MNEMTELEVTLRAEIVLRTHELKEYKKAFENFKSTGRPITLPQQLTPQEYNCMVDYIRRQDKLIQKALKRAKRLKAV